MPKTKHDSENFDADSHFKRSTIEDTIAEISSDPDYSFDHGETDSGEYFDLSYADNFPSVKPDFTPSVVMKDKQDAIALYAKSRNMSPKYLVKILREHNRMNYAFGKGAMSLFERTKAFVNTYVRNKTFEPGIDTLIDRKCDELLADARKIDTILSKLAKGQKELYDYFTKVANSYYDATTGVDKLKADIAKHRQNLGKIANAMAMSKNNKEKYFELLKQKIAVDRKYTMDSERFYVLLSEEEFRKKELKVLDIYTKIVAVIKSTLSEASQASKMLVEHQKKTKFIYAQTQDSIRAQIDIEKQQNDIMNALKSYGMLLGRYYSFTVNKMNQIIDYRNQTRQLE